MDLANRYVATSADSKRHAGKDVFSRLISAGSTTFGEDTFSRFTTAGSATFGGLSREGTPLTLGSVPIPLTTLDGYSREGTPLEGFLIPNRYPSLAVKRNDKIQPAGDDCSPCTCNTADASPLGPDAGELNIRSDDMWEWHTGRTHAGELNVSSDDMWEWHTGRTHAGELNISSDDMWEWHTGQTHAA